MDANYYYAAISSVVGGLSGFQSVHNRYPNDSLGASRTLPGFGYLATRALFPACIFIAFLSFSETVRHHPIVYAALLGVSAEAVLRSKILWKEVPKEGGGLEENYFKSPLDLLHWYQDLLLQSADTRRAKNKQEHLKQLVPREDFLSLCARATDNLAAFTEEKPAIRTTIAKTKTEFEEEAKTARLTPEQLQEKYRRILGLRLLRVASKSELVILFDRG